MNRSPSLSRDMVLASALAAFARKGYAGTSVDDIVRATRLSKPTLYYHFGSKEGLFRALLDSAYDGAFAVMESRLAAARTCRDRLLEMAAGLFEFASRHRHLIRLLFAAVFAAPGELPRGARQEVKRRRIFLLARRVILDCQRTGALTREHTADELANGFFGAVSHQIRTWLLRAEGPLNRHRANRTVALFLNGASARASKP